jgi:hypothetical protein
MVLVGVVRTVVVFGRSADPGSGIGGELLQLLQIDRMLMVLLFGKSIHGVNVGAILGILSQFDFRFVHVAEQTGNAAIGVGSALHLPPNRMAARVGLPIGRVLVLLGHGAATKHETTADSRQQKPCARFA